MGSGSEGISRFEEGWRGSGEAGGPDGAACEPVGGLTGWLVERIARLARSRPRRALPRLALIERIALAPRQSLALVEAEGRRILVATSAEGASVFFPLDGGAQPAGRNQTARNRLEDLDQSSPARGQKKPVAFPKPIAVHERRVSGPRVSW